MDKRVAWLLLPFTVLASCVGDSELAGPTFSQVDSAGIEIVTSRSPAWSGSDAWTVSNRPTVTIGELDGPLEFTFGDVVAAGTLSDGRIFVGDSQAHTIRIFSAEGDYLGSMGREGEGPGELQWFLTVSPYRADSLWVYDYAQSTVSIFGPDLTFVRRFRNPVPVGNYWVVSSFSDGRFLLYSPGSGDLDGGGPGIFPDSSAIVVSAPDGSAADTIGAFQTTMRNLGPDGRPLPVFLQASGAALSSGTRVVVHEGIAFQYSELDSDGTVRRIVRKDHSVTPVTADVIAAFGEHYVEWVGSGAEANMARIRRSLEEGHYPERLPATGYEVLDDALGNTWVSAYHFPGRPAESWEVFDPDGVWLGTVTTPPSLEVKEIGLDRLIGVATDDFDVPYVQVHRLDRRARDPR